uniref:Uncharacterized protein n=1 Tax=Oryza glumipatula TaxID=40148 RepID=A0A0E0AB88_9ORYZ
MEEIVSIRSTRGRYNIKVSCEDPKATKKSKTMKSGEWKDRRRMPIPANLEAFPVYKEQPA